MLYFTQMVFVKGGQEEAFNLFEAYVLPLLSKHRGTLIYRVRPTDGCVVTTSIGYPYELHLIAFETKENFQAYLNDEERLKYLHLKEASIEKTLLIEGVLV